MFVVTLAETASNGMPTSEDFISKLIPSWPSFVAQVGALLVMIVVVLLLVYKPVKKLIKSREDYIEQNIRDAEKSNGIAKANEAKSEALIYDSKKEADNIVENSKKAAIIERNNLLEETNKEITLKKLQAEKDIESAKIEAKEEIRQEMVDLALATSKEILKREVSNKDNVRLAEEFIAEVKK